MGEIIKFPQSRSCESCHKPLGENQGFQCPYDGCEALSCVFCLDASPYCTEHIQCDPTYGEPL